MTSIVRCERRTPARFRGRVVVDGGDYDGMPIVTYLDGIYTRSDGRVYERFVHYMTEEAYTMFPAIMHHDTPRAKTGKPKNPQIAIKENLALTGILVCELCGKKYDQTVSGAKVFKIDSTSDQEPSSSASKSVTFLLDKLARGAAQIICSDCEYTKTCLAKPFAQGSNRKGPNKRAKRGHVLVEEDDESDEE
jgi:hypothetical protein